MPNSQVRMSFDGKRKSKAVASQKSKAENNRRKKEILRRHFSKLSTRLNDIAKTIDESTKFNDGLMDEVFDEFKTIEDEFENIVEQKDKNENEIFEDENYDYSYREFDSDGREIKNSKFSTSNNNVDFSEFSSEFFNNLDKDNDTASTELVRSKRSIDDFDDYDFDGCEKQNNDTIKLPGAEAVIDENLSNKPLATLLKSVNVPAQFSSVEKSNTFGILPEQFTLRIRDYLDMLMSSTLLEMVTIETNNVVFAMLGIVKAILNYNNILFKKYHMVKTQEILHEPVWYSINAIKNELTLYVNEEMYDNFCMTSCNDKPIVFLNGHIDIEQYNPLSQPNHVPEIKFSVINLAIVSDHVSQHIITEVYNPKAKYNLNIHDGFRKYGVTLHSIFDLEVNSVQKQKIEYNNFINFTSSSVDNRPFSSSSQIFSNLLGGIGSNSSCTISLYFAFFLHISSSSL